MMGYAKNTTVICHAMVNLGASDERSESDHSTCQKTSELPQVFGYLI
jgi:hypothetical protein